jgi:thiol:disulfide interchange protein/DsbC/DsbD-like thiol-disulfide interchange protein
MSLLCILIAMIRSLLVTCALLPLLFSGLRAEPVKAQYATLELLSETTTVVPGETLNLALHFELEPHWHIYWKNPGASGLPPEIEWDLPEGFVAGAMQFPAPERIEVGGLMSYAYEDVATFIVPIEVPEDLELGATIRIGAEVFYLICKDICLPGDASLSLELLVSDAAQSSADAARFDAARASQPIEASVWQFEAEVREQTMDLRVVGPEIPENLYFYASDEGFVDPNAPQPFSIEDGVGILELPLGFAYFEAESSVLKGVLQSPDSSWAVEIRESTGSRVGSVAEPTESAPSVVQSGNEGFEQKLLDLGLGGWMTLALLGGLVLNIMPCVLPVLSLKVFSLLNHSGQSRGQALAHGFAYTLGVVASFLVLAGVLFALRAIGQSIGWGFQLQNPGFVLVLALVFFVFGLNLLGVFEIGGGLVGADQKVAGRKDLFGSFGVGVLAAVVGAPCVGPLVGGVSGVALQTNTVTGLAIFAMMGLGMASPFLFLAAFPKLVGYLPKPGDWMVVFKQSMGFLLMASVVFLVYLMGQLAGLSAITTTLIVLFLASLAAWVFGTWAAPHRSRKSKGVGRLLTLALIAIALVWGLPAVQLAYQANLDTVATESSSGGWKPWSPEAVEVSLDEGRPVFVDFTASWCLICQVNKKTALRTEATAELFDTYDVVTYSADWTRYDPAITEELERYGRSGVPLYLLINRAGVVRVLPQNLTNGTIREAVESFLDAK